MKWQRLNIIVFLAMLLCFTAAIALFPRDERTTERENRAFNRFPELSAQSVLSGEFSASFGPYLSDRVGYRATLIDVARGVDKLHGFAPGGVRISGDTLALRDRIMEIFMRAPELETRYANALAAYRAALPSDTRMYALLVPTQLEFQPKLYSTVADSEHDAIDAVYAPLRDAGIGTVDAYSALEAHADEYIYFRSDHHWTALGAYYAYREFSVTAGFEPRDISEYTAYHADNFLGYLYNREPVPGLAPDTVDWYEYPGLETSQPLFYPPSDTERTTYGIFLGGDHDEYVIETSAGTGRIAIVVKDSYANAFVPWLAPHYDMIVIVDPREYTGSVTELAARYENADLIFVNYVLATTFEDFIGFIEAVR